MSEVKRYNPELEKGIGLRLPCLSMLGNPYGEWVHYQDYAELKAERDALAAENARLRDFMLEYCVVECDDGYGVIELPAEGFFPKTINTDAYLNSVRAEGVEILTGKLQQLIDEGVFDAKEIGVTAGAVHEGAQIAAQLRAGKDGE